MHAIFLLIVSIIVTLISISGGLRFPFTKPSISTVEPEKTLFSPSPTPSQALPPLPSSKILSSNYHVFQTFNNCGPAALSMALSYYGINKSQEELGRELRPYQNPQGDNDDKSVTLEELADKSKEFGLFPIHRPLGSRDQIKHFLSNDMPVITRTWLNEEEDIGHYRIIKGFDDTEGVFIQDDSLQNKNLRYTYDDFSSIWSKFNYEYLVLVPEGKKEIADAILGDYVDAYISWENAIQNSLNELSKNPDDIYSRFNLSVAYYHTHEYQKSVEEFEKVETRLPFRTLWYQIEPIRAYFELGRFDRVFQITDKIISNHNRAYSELYLIRGEIYQKQNNPQLARQEFEKAVLYNANLKRAQEALDSVIEI